MNILILGGTGVIGSGIHHVLSKKYFVYSLNSKIYNRKSCEYFINKKIKFDLFVHAAGVTDEEIKEYGNTSSFRRASTALKKLTKHLVVNGCKNFVYISSQRVYLNFYKPRVAIFDEDRSKVMATSIYEKCHLKSENIFKKISKVEHCQSLIIRPGVVYGFANQSKKNSRPNLIQHSFPSSLIKNNEIKLNSSGKQFRNFSYNYDIGKIVFNWMNLKAKKDFTISNAKGMILTVIDFAKMCSIIYNKLSKKKSRVRVNVNQNQVQKFKKFQIKQKIKFKSNVALNLRKFIESLIKLNLKK
jgi:nucleoside-diphosphate-sugar epimerase